MKKMRKGFTLIELMIVIGIMGILGAMGMMAGKEATDAAKASNIADNLEKAASAMMSYYIENHATIDVSGATIKDVVTGANAYLKGTLQEGTTTAVDTEGVYSVVMTAESSPTAKWYVAYRLLQAEIDGNVDAVLANKATRLQLKDKAVDVPAVEEDKEKGINAKAAEPVAPYDGTTDTVYMFVR